jgi:Retroviral aspartyl protease
LSNDKQLIYARLKVEGKNSFNFIIDTGATISVLKSGSAENIPKINTNSIEILGIGGKIKTLGKIELKICPKTGDQPMKHQFHVIDIKL